MHKSGQYIISLKICRLKKENQQLIIKTDKSITLNQLELNNLINYINQYYTQLNMGITQFIFIDQDIIKLFQKINNLGLSDKEIVDKLSELGILTQNLSVSITALERSNAIKEFEQAIDVENYESF